MPGNIYILGFMGAGKSTAARLLAELLKRDFLDLDCLVEQQSGMDVASIFRVHGEAEFRRMELAALAAVAEQKNVVVAVGGGLPAVPGAMDIMKSSGVTVFLHTPLNVITERMTTGEAAKRPLWNNYTELEALYLTRLPFYRQADFTIPGDATPGEIAKSIAAQL